MKKKNVVVTIGLIVILTVISGISFTSAYFQDKDKIKNNFTTAIIETEIEEKFEPDVENPKRFIKEVKIRNSARTESLIRVSINEIWRDENNPEWVGEVNSSLVTLNYDKNLDSNWIYGNDGYYYYRKKLAPDESTELLLESVVFNEIEDDSEYIDKTYEIDIKSEAVQANRFIDEDNNEIYSYEKVWLNITDENVIRVLKNIINGDSIIIGDGE
ncbi:MAG: hypothetical protein RR894_14450 [Terrisporobacter sp.]